ncbi:MAG: AAA family ATPase [Pseudomonadota bacterium]
MSEFRGITHPEVEPDLEALDAASKLLTKLTLGTSIEIIKDRSYAFKGLLWADTVAVIYGAKGSAKSYAALDMAVHYAKGQDWRGHRVQGGKVVYVAAEGGVGMVNRVAAIGDVRDTFGLLTTRLDLRTSSLAARAVVIMAHEAMGGDFRMIAIDTLARSLGGGEDSSGVDMGLFVENCDLIRELTGAAVVVNHHTGKDATTGARGSTVMNARSILVARAATCTCSMRVSARRGGRLCARSFQPSVRTNAYSGRVAMIA